MKKIFQNTANTFGCSTAAWLALFTAAAIWSNGLGDVVEETTRRIFGKEKKD